MKKNKICILILVILNMLATFLPYGWISYEKRYYLWKNPNMRDVWMDPLVELVDKINEYNAYVIYGCAFLLLCSAIVYNIKDNNITKMVTKFSAGACVLVNLFFCYHLYEPYSYRYIDIGVILSLCTCSMVIMCLTKIKLRNFLILCSAIVLSFPAFIIFHSFDIESGVDEIFYSIQMYFFTLYNDITYNHPTWIAAIPAMIVVIMVGLSVISILYDWKMKNASVWLMMLCCLVAYVVDVMFMMEGSNVIQIKYAYPIAILLAVSYLIVEIVDKRSE